MLNASTQPSRSLSADRVSGAVILIAAGLIVALLAHHPVADGASTAARLQNLAQLEKIDNVVHGALAGVMIAVAAAFGAVAQRLGLERFSVRAAWLAYGVGTAATVAAALIDGFVAPALAAQSAATPDAIALTTGLLRLCGMMIQVCTKAGLALTGAGVVIWAFHLIRKPGLPRLAGASGLIGGGAPLAILLATQVVLTPHVLIGLMLGQTLWSVTVAVWLIWGGAAAKAEI